MSAWLNNRNDLDNDASQSAVFKAMMAKASKAGVSEPPQTPKPVGKEKKQVRFDMKSPKPYTPTQSSPKGDPAWAPQIDWTSYAPMALSAVILGGTYMMSGTAGKPLPVPGGTRPAPVNIPGLGTF